MAKTPKAAPLRSARQRRAAAAEEAMPEPHIAPASLAVASDLFEAIVASPSPDAVAFTSAHDLPTAAATAPASAPPASAPPASAPPAPRTARAAGKAAKGTALKAGVGLKMVTPEGEESIIPFKSVEDLLSGIKPYLRDAARSPEPVWFCLETIDLADFDFESS